MTDLVLRRTGDLWRWLRAADAVWLLVAAIPLAVWLGDPARAPDVLGTATRAFSGTLPFIVFAVLLIGYLKASGAEGVVGRAFRGREGRMIVLGALVGGLAPFCSCEVIPFVAALLAAGTPISAVMAFWLASPLMDPAQFAITAGALGAEFAVGKLVAAIAIGLTGGFAIQAAMARGLFAEPLKAQPKKSCCGCGPSPLKGQPRWAFWHEAPRRAAFRDATREQALFLGKWLALAYLLEGLLIHYVPAEAIGGLVGGPGVWPVVLGALLGAPAYLNGYAAPALVSGLMGQGMSAGAAMSFMVAGAATSIPAMAAVFALVRRPVFGAYLALGIGGAIAAGLVFGAVHG